MNKSTGKAGVIRAADSDNGMTKLVRRSVHVFSCALGSVSLVASPQSGSRSALDVDVLTNVPVSTRK
jgi:hypothetical protein